MVSASAAAVSASALASVYTDDCTGSRKGTKADQVLHLVCFYPVRPVASSSLTYAENFKYSRGS